jgi:hypothetical protein
MPWKKRASSTRFYPNPLRFQLSLGHSKLRFSLASNAETTSPSGASREGEADLRFSVIFRAVPGWTKPRPTPIIARNKTPQ